jgi:hypothetical protein
MLSPFLYSVIITHTNCRGRAFNVVWLFCSMIRSDKVEKKKLARPISPFVRFPNPFGDEVAELHEKIEASAAADKNGEQIWLTQRNDLPSIFGRS